MKKWGVAVSAIYTIILVTMVVPFTHWAIGGGGSVEELFRDRYVWVWSGLLVAGEATLLLVPVDMSFRKVTDRRPILVSIAAVAVATTLLTWFGVWSFLIALSSRNESRFEFFGDARVLLLLWVFWAVVFYVYGRRGSWSVANLVSRLLRGSILELLVVVPSHVWVRHRGDCSAPVVTGFGIATGIAVMLMSFGPSVVFLYQRRLREYRSGHSTNQPGSGRPPKVGTTSIKGPYNSPATAASRH